MEAVVDVLASWALLAADYNKNTNRFMVFSKNNPTGRVVSTKQQAFYQVAIERERNVLIAIFTTGLKGGLLAVYGTQPPRTLPTARPR